MGGCNRVFFLCVLLTATMITQLPVPTDATYTLEVFVRYFGNPTNRTGQNTCCNAYCSACNNLFSFCLRPWNSDLNSNNCIWGNYATTWPLPLSSQIYGFSEYTQRIANLPNPLQFEGECWPGAFQLLVSIHHGTGQGVGNVLIDRVVANEQLGTLTYSGIATYTGIYNRVELQLGFIVLCSGESDCSAMCDSTNFITSPTRSTTNVPVTTCPINETGGLVFGITFVGITVVRECPQPTNPGHNVIGNSTRLCRMDGSWSALDITNCSRQDIHEITERAMAIFSANNTNISSMEVQSLLEDLSQATEPSASGESTQYPQDIANIVSIVNQATEFLHSNLQEENPLSFNEDVIDVVNNVLDESNEETLQMTLQTEEGVGQQILQSTEVYGQYVAMALMNDNVYTGDGNEKTLLRNNIELQVEIVNTAEQSPTDIIFPETVNEQPFAQSTIPAELITQQGGNVSVINIVFNTIGTLLPTKNVQDGSQEDNVTVTVASHVISTQLLGEKTTLEPPVVFEFQTTELSLPNDTTADNPKCAFWNFSLKEWSSEGIETTIVNHSQENNVFTVICKSDHLTSFAVLVDIHMIIIEIPEAELFALNIVSYIGLSISLVFLLITIIYLLSLRGLLFEQVLYFIHLNLTISLLLANVAFLAGIDTAVSNRYACAFVAALLHYLYTAAFYWMLCEGIMLFLKVVVPFTRIGRAIEKRWYIFFLIGWGIPVIIVGVSVGLIHNEYGTENYCWISVNDQSSVIGAFIVPIVVVIVINTVIFITSLGKIFSSRKTKFEHTKNKYRKLVQLILYNGMSILPLLGLTWIFGLLAVNRGTSVFLWLFTILNSLQGFFIFIFYIIRTPRVWNWLTQKVKKPTKSRQPTYSTIVNRQSIIESKGQKKSMDYEYQGAKHNTQEKATEDSV